jgi:L-aminopeptidase/D-esterase-like protein
MRWLDEQGIGMTVGPARLPIVPGAVLFDLPLGDQRIRPDAAAGYAACQAAGTEPPEEGNVGAGAGAVVGKIFGFHRAMKGGIGTASITVDGVTVGALIACNALGDVVDPGHRRP